jgi:hypothetical protein
MPKKPTTGEVLYARVPAGTKERVAVVRGVERESDWFRRLVLETLDSAEASQKSPQKAANRRGRVSRD